MAGNFKYLKCYKTQEKLVFCAKIQIFEKLRKIGKIISFRANSNNWKGTKSRKNYYWRENSNCFGKIHNFIFGKKFQYVIFCHFFLDYFLSFFHFFNLLNLVLFLSFSDSNYFGECTFDFWFGFQIKFWKLLIFFLK